MALDKNDLKEIREIVSEEIRDKVKDSEIKLVDKLDLGGAILRNEIRVSENKLRKEIGGTEDRLRKEIMQVGEKILEITEERDRKMKNEIISVITREVKDLAEINQAVIEKVAKIPEHEKRITRIETKLGLSRV